MVQKTEAKRAANPVAGAEIKLIYVDTQQQKETDDINGLLRQFMTSEAQKRAEKKYKQSDKGKATARRYLESDKGKSKEARYSQSEKGKARLKRFRQSEKGKIMHARFRQTEKGKIINARICAKRKRNLGYNVINNQFPGSEGHHINKDNVLFIPEELHQLNRHRLSDPESMKVINTLAFEWLVTQEML